jgi:hypothetical protein
MDLLDLTCVGTLVTRARRGSYPQPCCLHTYVQGLVSGLGRQLPGSHHPIRNVVQTTAGSGHQAGGVLMDSTGAVVGIVVGTPGQPACPLGFALPLDNVRGLVEQIMLFGRAMRPTLGITYAPQQVLKQAGVEGVLVLEVPAGSPAAAAGMRPTHRCVAAYKTLIRVPNCLRCISYLMVLPHKATPTFSHVDTVHTQCSHHAHRPRTETSSVTSSWETCSSAWRGASCGEL